MATAHLRKTFRYPTDGDIPKDLDEEEQEKLIKKLREDNEERNEQYKRILLAIPTIAATSFLPALLVSRRLHVKLVCILSAMSLIATAYGLIFVSSVGPASRRKSTGYRHPSPGPLDLYLLPLNGALSLLLSVNAYLLKDATGVHEGFWLLCLLPVVIITVVQLAKRLMLSVDIDELEGLKYGYKGA